MKHKLNFYEMETLVQVMKSNLLAKLKGISLLDQSKCATCIRKVYFSIKIIYQAKVKQKNPLFENHSYHLQLQASLWTSSTQGCFLPTLMSTESPSSEILFSGNSFIALQLIKLSTFCKKVCVAHILGNRKIYQMKLLAFMALERRI